MKRAIIIGWILFATLILGAEDKKANILLQAGVAKETVEGDLKSAIELYKKALKEAGTNRSLAAQALLHMADCYQKLGDAEGRRVYEKIVRDYADQKSAVAIAQARVNGAPGAAVRGDRAVWAAGNVDGFGTVSPDGRLLTYVDWAKTGALMLRDLAAGTDRPLNRESWLTGSKGGAQYSAISKDGKQVAYEWYVAKRVTRPNCLCENV